MTFPVSHSQVNNTLQHPPYLGIEKGNQGCVSERNQSVIIYTALDLVRTSAGPVKSTAVGPRSSGTGQSPEKNSLPGLSCPRNQCLLPSANSKAYL